MEEGQKKEEGSSVPKPGGVEEGERQEEQEVVAQQQQRQHGEFPLQQQQQQYYQGDVPYGYHLMDPNSWSTYAHDMHPGTYGYDYREPHRYGYHYPLQHMEGVPLPPGIPGLGGSTDPLEAVLGPFPCVRLKNLPYDASLENILALFHGLVVIDVVLVGGGEAFVIFANPMDFQMALQRNRSTIGRRFIELSSASRSEYYEAVATVHEQERGAAPSTTGLRLGDEGMRRGGSRVDQPSGDTASTVAALWGQQSSSPPMQSLTGQPGFVDSLGFNSGMTMGGRPPGGRDPGRGVLHAPITKRTGGGIQIGEHTGFLRMRGLPFSATKEDIYKFFVGYNPIQESIVLTYRNDGRATGEAYVGFATPDDAERAMALHRRSMGSRYIELFISNKDEQGRALARFGNR